MRTVILAVVAAGLFATARRAEAYPQYQLSRDQTCSGCHLSPAGGGLLTENGYSVAETMGQFTDNSAFMYGIFTPPSWLALGGDLRSSTGFLHTPDNSPVFIPMQADVYAHATLQNFSLHVTVGGRPAHWVTGNGTPSVLDRVWSREHYVMWQQDPASREGLFVRAGRFMPVFGLRFAEHPDYNRRFGGTELYAETYGAAVEYVKQGWEAHVTGFIEDPLIDPVVHDSGAAGYAEVRLNPRLQLGGELMVTKSLGNTWVRGGATAKAYLPSLDALFQAEMQVVHESVPSGSGPNQLVTYVMGSRSFGSSFMLDLGIGHFDENLAISGLDRDAVDVNLHWFLDSHMELVWQNRVEVLGLGQSRGGPTGAWTLLHAHYRL